jgi:hypothetical protein
LVSLEIRDKKIASATWCPCIKINGSYYMAQSGTDLGFNVNAGLSMTYMKVEPWGSSKTIEYDGVQKLTPQMRYQTSMFAEPERNEDYINDISIDIMTPTQASNGSNLRTGDSSTVIDALKAFEDIDNAIGLVSGTVNWNDIRSKVLGIRATTQMDAWNELTKVIPNKLWKGVDEKQRKDLANAVVVYNTVPASSESIPSVAPESFTEQSNSQGVNTSMTRQQMEDYIFDEFIKAVETKNGSAMPAEDKQSMRAMLSQNDEADLATAVQMIKQACRKNGVMRLDDQGNPMQGC